MRNIYIIERNQLSDTQYSTLKEIFRTSIPGRLPSGDILIMSLMESIDAVKVNPKHISSLEWFLNVIKFNFGCTDIMLFGDL